MGSRSGTTSRSLHPSHSHSPFSHVRAPSGPSTVNSALASLSCRSTSHSRSAAVWKTKLLFCGNRQFLTLSNFHSFRRWCGWNNSLLGARRSQKSFFQVIQQSLNVLGHHYAAKGTVHLCNSTDLLCCIPTPYWVSTASVAKPGCSDFWCILKIHMM